MPWELAGNAATNPASDFLGTTDSQPLSIRTGGTERIRVGTDGSLQVGAAGATAPARLTVVANGASVLAGTALSTTLVTAAGQLGATAGSDLPLASIGFHGLNNISLGVRAQRTTAGSGWPSTAIGLGMDVDNTVRAGAHLWLHASGNVGIGTPNPPAKLTVAVPGSPNPIGALSVDVESFGIVNNLFQSYFFRVRDIQAAPPNGLTHFYIRGDGSVGIGTVQPGSKLHIDLPSSPTPLRVMQIDVQSFQTMANAQASHYLLIRDIGAGASGTALIVRGDGNVGLGTASPQARLHVNGDIVVSGDIQLLGSDYAEDFDVLDAASAEPGTVMVLDVTGAVRISDEEYDHRVAGVVCGAGDNKPGVILGRRRDRQHRQPLALMGTVWCKVDAEYGAVVVGDLLTTSATPGHAMKATDRDRALGAVLGKALQPLSEGRELVPILIALQ